jgi:HK97 family phage portal protein
MGADYAEPQGWVTRLVSKLFGGTRKGSASAGSRVASEFEEYDESGATAKQVRTSIAPKINPWVYASIRKIAQSAAIVPVQVVTYTDKEGVRPEMVPLPDHPAWEVIETPNPHQSWAQFVEAAAWQLETWGRLFIELVRGGSDGKTGDVVALYVLRSRFMTVLPDAKTLVRGYEYRPNSNAIHLKPEQVCFVKFYDADSDLKGLSPLEAAKSTLDIDADAREHAAAAFGNDCTPGLILQSKDPLDQPVINRMHRNLEKWNAGPRNAKRPLILGGMEAKSIASSLRDMEFSELRRSDREELAAVFDVPPIKMGLMEFSSFANAKEQNRQFWVECVRPIVTLICDGLNRSWLKPQYGETDNVVLQPDLSQFVADPEEQRANEGSVLALWGGDLVTKNEARAKVGLKPIDDGTGDKFKSQIARPAAPPFNGGGQTPTAGGAAVAGAIPPDKDEEKSKDAPGGAREKPFRKRRFDPGDIESFLKARDDSALANEDPFRRVIENVFARQERRVLSLLEGQVRAEKAIAKGPKDKDRARVLRQIQLALDEEMERAAREIEAQIRVAVGDGAAVASDQIGFEVDFNLYDPRVTKYVNEKRIKLADEVNATTMDRIKAAVTEGLETGRAPSQIEDDIRAAFAGEGPERSRPDLIARTEMGSAANAGVAESMVQSGVVEKKRWITTGGTAGDGHTRETHGDAHDQVVKIDEPFEVGGYQMMFPGDVSLGAPAKETIGCRCTSVPDFIEATEP